MSKNQRECGQTGKGTKSLDSSSCVLIRSPSFPNYYKEVEQGEGAILFFKLVTLVLCFGKCVCNYTRSKLQGDGLVVLSAVLV